MSGASVSDVNDRLSALELRVQQQEDELTVMKAALADVLRRLAASEVSAASSTKKQHGGKGNVPFLNYLILIILSLGDVRPQRLSNPKVNRIAELRKHK